MTETALRPINIAVVMSRRKNQEMMQDKPYVVECRKGGIDNLVQRRQRSQWLIKFCGPRGARWDFFIRPEGGSTMCFAAHADAVLFKLTWAGNV